MNLDYNDHRSDAYGSACETLAVSQGPLELYEPSVTSSAPSSQSSVFSDNLSAQSSIASSISDDFRPSHDDPREHDRIWARVQLHYQAKRNAQTEEPSALEKLIQGRCIKPSYADIISIQKRHQHPRRCNSSNFQQPPQLVRQRDRKINFVDNLVDAAAQMVEVIWPLSVVPCTESANSRGVLPLRTYIEETLRRSRTSYSTLQVALYYLILVKPYVPRNDFTMEQEIDCAATRALMCGRRMFLAALILASKYLQDRNYSAKAWSKMSGLRADEINANERVFLAKIQWRLHISKPTFELWQEVVLRYTSQPSRSGFEYADLPSCGPLWKSVVPLLTPELDKLPMGPFGPIGGVQTPESPMESSPVTPTPTQASLRPMDLETSSQETTPTPAMVLPSFLEPTPDIAPPTPPLARMGPLPTPQMTPSSVTSSTPAVSAYGSRRSSMCSAMATAHKTNLSRCVMDARPSMSRRPSLMSTSSGSSPESLMSDISRPSRSSSISSISTVSTNSSMAPVRVPLARLATCRNVRLPLPGSVKEESEEGSMAKPIVIDDDMEMVSSPDMADFTVSEKVLHAPHRHSKHAPQVAPAPVADKGRKRCRSRGHHRRADLQEEVRYLLNEYGDDMEDESDEIVGSPSSSAADLASDMLAAQHLSSSGVHTRQVLPPTSSARPGATRVPLRSYNGKKRTCLSSPLPWAQARSYHDDTLQAR